MRAAVVGVVVLIAGCLGPAPDPMWATQRQSARSIPNAENRASALGTIAQSAAYAGDPATAADAVGDLKGHPSHDDVAARCSAVFTTQDRPGDARRLARLIDDPAQRKTALDKITEKPAGANGDQPRPATNSQ